MSEEICITPVSKNDLDKKQWVKFVNSLSGFKSANLIGTSSLEGIENLSMVSSVFHVGASPALMGYVSRPNSVSSARDTLNNILESKMFTINHVHKNLYKRAHQASARYLPEESEFDECSIEPELKAGLINAPYVKESVIKIGLELVETHDIKVNNTVIVIGEIKEVYINKSFLMPDGYIDVEKAGSLSVSGLDSYHIVRRLSRLSYAKRGLNVKELDVKGDFCGVD